MSEYYYVVNKNNKDELKNYQHFLNELGNNIASQITEYAKHVNGEIINENSISGINNDITKFINDVTYIVSYDEIKIGRIESNNFNFLCGDFFTKQEFIKYYNENGGDKKLEIIDDYGNSLTINQFIELIHKKNI